MLIVQYPMQFYDIIEIYATPLQYHFEQANGVSTYITRTTMYALLLPSKHILSGIPSLQLKGYP